MYFLNHLLYVGMAFVMFIHVSFGINCPGHTLDQTILCEKGLECPLSPRHG